MTYPLYINLYIIVDVGSLQVWIIRGDANGDTLWTITRFGGQFKQDIKQTPDGGFIWTGSAYCGNCLATGILVSKIDENGLEEWESFFPARQSLGRDSPVSINLTNDGGYILTGYIDSPDKIPYDLFVIRLNAVGDVLWKHIYGSSNDYAQTAGVSCLQAKDGGFAILGFIEESGFPLNAWLLRTDEQGDTLWAKEYADINKTIGYSLIETADKGFLFTGNKRVPPDLYEKIWIVRTNSLGDTLWTETFTDDLISGGQSITSTSDGGFVIAGYTWNVLNSSHDALIVKFAKETITPVGEIKFPDANNTFNLDFPNPINSIAEISYLLKKDAKVILDFYDISGNNIASIINERQSVELKTIPFDGSNYPTGIYYFKMNIDGIISTKKTIIY